MLIKLNQILLFGLGTLILAFSLYPYYIQYLRKTKAGQNIRQNDVTGQKSIVFSKLHKHKKGTPTMGGALFLLIMLIMIGISVLIYKLGIVSNSLRNRQETYIILFGFFSMGIIGLVDDILNIRNIGNKKGLSVRAKIIGMIFFAAFISRRFYVKLDVSYIDLRPLYDRLDIGLLFPLLTFFITIAITNAINITDGLDGLVGGLMSMVFFALGVITFYNQTYIASAVLVIVLMALMAFTYFNIFPAKIFMGDSGSLALGGLLATLLFLLNMRIGILIPFVILFLLFIIDIGSSLLQIIRKKYLKRKLFTIAPLHHSFEKKGWHETTIVMKARFLQLILLAVFLIMMFYQISGNEIIG